MATGGRDDTRSSHGAWLVVGGVLALAVVLGVTAFWRYKVSENHLHEAFRQLERKGRSLDAEGCVGAVLSWHRECRAMKSLCDHAVPMALEHCLAVRDRDEACERIVEEEEATGRWTWDQCEARGLSRGDGTPRSTRNACTEAYRALAQFCSSDDGGVVP